MKTKYFRFLYCGMRACMVHFGELTDTYAEKKFAFLYIQGGRRKADEAKVEEAPFVCPKHIDLLVLGNVNEQVESVLADILGNAEVDMLVLPQSGYFWKTKPSERARRVIDLSCAKSTQEEKSGENAFAFSSVGWRFFMKSYAEGSVSMAHGLDLTPGLFRRHFDMENEIRGGRKNPFEDCVMNVKVIDGGRRCCREESPDGYVCALGCALRKDYDVCRYQQTGTSGVSYLTGTLLCGDESCVGNVKEDLGQWLPEVRFFGLPMCRESMSADEGQSTKEKGLDRKTGNTKTAEKQSAEENDVEIKREQFVKEMAEENSGSLLQEKELEKVADSHKRYYIGWKGEMSDEAIAAVCNSGMYQVPVLLENGEGICCSGMLRYAE